MDSDPHGNESDISIALHTDIAYGCGACWNKRLLNYISALIDSLLHRNFPSERESQRLELAESLESLILPFRGQWESGSPEKAACQDGSPGNKVWLGWKSASPPLWGDVSTGYWIGFMSIHFWGMQFYSMMDLDLNTMWLSFRLASTLLLLIVKASEHSWTTSSENFSTGSKSFTVILFGIATFEFSKSKEDCFWFSHEAASLSVHLSGGHSPTSCYGFGRCGSKS